ncbi:MAG TPA: hypothetical protein VMX94_00980 [Armatimonadota bacterium]|nr:hypothetical protein [Armatimonadota bacterium]
MDLYEFKKLVFGEFGESLEHATAENVRGFLDRVQNDVLGARLKDRIVLEEHASTYEEVLKDFFANVLELPKDDAIMMLWLLAFDLAFSAIELQQADKFKSLFREYE